MRTQKYIQVEGIVAKYKDLASKAVKIETKEDEFISFIGIWNEYLSRAALKEIWYEAAPFAWS